MKDFIAFYIKHDIAKVKNLDFMIFNIDRIARTNLINKVFIFVYSTDPNTSRDYKSEQIDRVIKEVKHSTGIEPVIWKNTEDKILDELVILTNIQDAEGIKNAVLEMNGTIIWVDSGTLFPRSFMIDCVQPELEETGERIIDQDLNIRLPVMHYKYKYKTIIYNNKERVVKEFIKTKDPFYLSHHVTPITKDEEIPDWDERFYITHEILEKTEGAMPVVTPSPLLHNWGKTELFIQNTKEGEHAIFPNSKMLLHKFEEIFEGEE